MNYSELVQAYFERSTALQWYWTIYVLAIGGVLGFSTFRQRPELVTTILVSILYACFAFKNVGAIEAIRRCRLAAMLSSISPEEPNPVVFPAIVVMKSTVPTRALQDIGGIPDSHVGARGKTPMRTARSIARMAV